MKPVWIKYWGLIPMTRRGYLIALAVAGLIAIAIFAVFGFLGRLPPMRTLWQEVPIRTPHAWEYWFFNNLYRIIAICLLAQVIDTVVVLRRFARKQAEQVAQHSEAPVPVHAEPNAAGSGTDSANANGGVR
jgi:hypothetical protein